MNRHLEKMAIEENLAAWWAHDVQKNVALLALAQTDVDRLAIEKRIELAEIEAGRHVMMAVNAACAFCRADSQR